MIVAVYNIVAVMAQPIIYNYWAILGLDIYQIVIWLTAMALLASEISGTGSIGLGLSVVGFSSGISTGDGDNCYYGYCFRKRSLERRYISVKTAKAARDALAATCGLAGLELYVCPFILIRETMLTPRSGSSSPSPSSSSAWRSTATARREDTASPAAVAWPDPAPSPTSPRTPRPRSNSRSQMPSIRSPSTHLPPYHNHKAPRSQFPLPSKRPTPHKRHALLIL